MGLSFWHVLIVLLVVLILFGAKGKIPQVMNDLGKGIRSFKSGMEEGKSTDTQTQQLPPSDKDKPT